MGTQVFVALSEEEFAGQSEDLNHKLAQAAQQGFFYIEIPEALREAVHEAEEYAYVCHKDPKLLEADRPGVTGFHDFGQTTSFVCEGKDWSSLFPTHITELAEALGRLSVTMLKKLLPLVVPQLSPERWNEATGGLTNGGGLFGFSFNHYFRERQAIGYPAHRDIGLITILFINQEGLYAYIDNKWCPVAPKPGYFVVNFGKALELLVNDRSKLSACCHVVERITKQKHGHDRISFGLFSNNEIDAPVMCVTQDGLLAQLYATYQEFNEVELARVKNDNVDIPKFESTSME